MLHYVASFIRSSVIHVYDNQGMCIK